MISEGFSSLPYMSHETFKNANSGDVKQLSKFVQGGRKSADKTLDREEWGMLHK
jgi:hypothetical protein